MANMSQGFSASELMTVWEQGSTLDDVGRAVLLLAQGERMPPEVAWRIDIGQRDQRLLALRSATFGTRLETFLECDACREPLEFSMDARQLQNMKQAVSDGITDESMGWTMRLPDSRDLRAASQCSTPEMASKTLFLRCVSADDSVQLDASEEHLQRFSDWLVQRSPEIELLLKLDCPACGKSHDVLLDIASFFWREIESACARLVREVDALARVYGWGEDEILRMTPARRQIYLQAVTS
jgi:hypothetical protein